MRHGSFAGDERTEPKQRWKNQQHIECEMILAPHTKYYERHRRHGRSARQTLCAGSLVPIAVRIDIHGTCSFRKEIRVAAGIFPYFVGIILLWIKFLPSAGRVDMFVPFIPPTVHHLCHCWLIRSPFEGVNVCQPCRCSYY